MNTVPTTPTSDPDIRCGVVWACPDCEVSAGPYPTRAEAELLASTHDLLHHRGRRTACVSSQSRCESCRRRPAVITWHYPAAGAPFALCRSCVPTDASCGTDRDATEQSAGVAR
jgi:hypothetical protein